MEPTPQQRIDELCERAGCSEKIRKVHFQQYVHRRWNPHPPQKFLDWWNRDGAVFTENKSHRAWYGVKPVVAYNCEAVREAYREARQLGLADAF